MLITEQNSQNKKNNLDKGKGKTNSNKIWPKKVILNKKKIKKTLFCDKENCTMHEWSVCDDEPLDKIRCHRSANKRKYFGVKCIKSYGGAEKKDDWLRCIKYAEWFCEFCTTYTDMCNVCSKAKLREKKLETTTIMSFFSFK